MSADPDLSEFTSDRTQREELQFAVLSGLVTQEYNAGERFAIAERLLRPEHFEGGDFFPMWRILTWYYALIGSVPGQEEFDELLAREARLTLETRAGLSSAFTELQQEEITQARFVFSCHRLRERVRDEEFSATLATTSAIHFGAETVDGDELSGFEDAHGYLNRQLAALANLQDETPEGDMNLEGAEIVRAYHDAKGGAGTGVLTGFQQLDGLTAGIQPGELWLVAAYTGEGKSKVAMNVAYHAAYMQGKSVVFGTAELSREQVRRNMVCLHSRHEKFGYPRGLRYHDVRLGRLDEEGESVLRAATADMRDRQNGYGRMFIFTVPERSNIEYIAAKLRQERRKFDVDLLVVDYLGLLTSRHRRQQRREELDDMLISAKRLAASENVPLLSPWQVSRAAWEKAVDNGQYTRAALSDTSQAEKSSDLILSLLRRDDEHELQCEILKYRDGEGSLSFTLHTDFATSYVGESDTLRGLI